MDERPFYMGHKNLHAFGFQSVMTLDGIISLMAVLVEGSQGDWKLWVEAGVVKSYTICLELLTPLSGIFFIEMVHTITGGASWGLTELILKLI